MISIKKLSKIYASGSRRVTILDGIDLTVSSDEILAVIGPSGAGKSTLARCINLLDRPTSGSVAVDGIDLMALSESALRIARRSIGTVFQASNMLGRRTAAQNVALPLEYMGVNRQQRDARVGELLERVGMAAHAHHYPHQLSGGQRQRIGIARALALRPTVLLADEATSGLDPDNTASIIALLREVRKDLGLTVLMITHDMHVVRKVADRVARLSHGRIIEQGALLDLLTDPNSALGQSLLPPVDIPLPFNGREIWRVGYKQAEVVPDWMTRLSTEIGSRIDLLSASVETIAGVPVGQVILGVQPGTGDRLAILLDQWGLSGVRTGRDDLLGDTGSKDILEAVA